MGPNELRRLARDELRASRAWWTDDSNFGAILPPALADGLRTPAYAIGVGLACVALAPLLHLEIDPRGTAIGIALLLLAAWLYRIVDSLCRAYEGAPATSDPPAGADAQYPATGDTIRLSEVGHE